MGTVFSYQSIFALQLKVLIIRSCLRLSPGCNILLRLTQLFDRVNVNRSNTRWPLKNDISSDECHKMMKFGCKFGLKIAEIGVIFSNVNKDGHNVFVSRNCPFLLLLGGVIVRCRLFRGDGSSRMPGFSFCWLTNKFWSSCGVRNISYCQMVNDCFCGSNDVTNITNETAKLPHSRCFFHYRLKGGFVFAEMQRIRFHTILLRAHTKANFCPHCFFFKGL